MLGLLVPFLQPVLNFFGGPVIKGAIDAYKAKLAAGNDKDRIAAELAGRELVVQQRELELQQQYKIALIGHWYEPPTLMGYILVFYIGKAMVWDAALGLGTTDSIRDANIIGWAGMIMAFWVGVRGIVSAVRILKS